MTFEEIQQTIQGMLEVQRELQQTQINISAQIAKNNEEIDKLIEQGKQQDKRIEQLIGYSISQAGDVIDVQMALRGIYARLSKLEDRFKEDEE